MNPPPRSTQTRPKFDFLIVGAGFSGLVLAERLSSQLGKKCLVVEKRDHIGGNAYDYIDSAGVLVHKYGPHYFRTNSDRVFDYLSQFTEWTSVDYRIQSYTDGRFWSFPINLKTYEQLIGRGSSQAEFENYLRSVREPIENPQNSEEIVLSRAGREFYERFFLNYTQKQWQRHPRELDAAVCGRIPIRTNRDDRFLNEKHQKLPKEGYTRLFENMIANSPGIEIELGADFETARTKYRYDHLVYTGPIDSYYGFRFGPLAYRSLRFEFASFGPEELREREAISGKRGFWQPAMQVNYPNGEEFTRIVEIKHATGQLAPNTTIAREFPQDFVGDAEPYYPIPSPETKALAARYGALAKMERNVTFAGRLARYRYFNMDQVVAMALKEFNRIAANQPCGAA